MSIPCTLHEHRMSFDHLWAFVVLPEGEYPVRHWKIMRRDDKGDKWQLQGSGFSKKALLKASNNGAANLEVGEPVKVLPTD